MTANDRLMEAWDALEVETMREVSGILAGHVADGNGHNTDMTCCDARPYYRYGVEVRSADVYTVQED